MSEEFDWSIITEAVFDDEIYVEDTSSGDTLPGNSYMMIGQKDQTVTSADRKSPRTSVKRKRESLQQHVRNLEEQNRIMRAALAAQHISPEDLFIKQSKRLDTLKNLFAIFNIGDVEELTNFLISNIGKGCLVLTPSLFTEIHGSHAVIQFWCLLLEAFPDGIFQLSDTKGTDNGFVSTRFSFTGTKVAPLPADLLLSRWSTFRETMLVKRDPGHQESTPVAFGVTNSSASPTGDVSTVDAKQNSSEKLNPSRSQTCNDDLPSQQPSLSHTDSDSKVEEKLRDCPVVKISGFVTCTFDQEERVNRFVFIWNTASLIGQLLKLSDGDLEQVSHFFSAPGGQAGDETVVTAASMRSTYRNQQQQQAESSSSI